LERFRFFLRVKVPALEPSGEERVVFGAEAAKHLYEQLLAKEREGCKIEYDDLAPLETHGWLLDPEQNAHVSALVSASREAIVPASGSALPSLAELEKQALLAIGGCAAIQDDEEQQDDVKDSLFDK